MVSHEGFFFRTFKYRGLNEMFNGFKKLEASKAKESASKQKSQKNVPRPTSNIAQRPLPGGTYSHQAPNRMASGQAPYYPPQNNGRSMMSSSGSGTIGYGSQPPPPMGWYAFLHFWIFNLLVLTEICVCDYLGIQINTRSNLLPHNTLLLLIGNSKCMIEMEDRFHRTANIIITLGDEKQKNKQASKYQIKNTRSIDFNNFFINYFKLGKDV
jgi:hypothetical protein